MLRYKVPSKTGATQHLSWVHDAMHWMQWSQYVPLKTGIPPQTMSSTGPSCETRLQAALATWSCAARSAISSSNFAVSILEAGVGNKVRYHSNFLPVVTHKAVACNGGPCYAFWKKQTLLWITLCFSSFVMPQLRAVIAMLGATAAACAAKGIGNGLQNWNLHQTRWKPRTRMYSRSWTTSENLCNRKTNIVFMHRARISSQRRHLINSSQRDN